VSRLRQVDAGLLCSVLHERVGHLDQDAGTVAGIDLATASAPVIQILESLYRLSNNIVRFPTFYVCNETDAAGIMLELRIIEALSGWRARRGVLLVHVYASSDRD
jgi:hypothetical protein